MNGIHDMGGMDGFGAVDPVEAGGVFHAKWEGKVMADSRVMGAIGAWNIDQGRYGIEMLPPHLYLTSYYRRWLERFERAMVAYGYADADEIAAGRALRPGKTPPRGQSSPSPISTGSVTAAPSRDRKPRSPGSRWAIGSSRGTCIPEPIPAYHAMSAAMSVWWSGCTAVTSSRIQGRWARVKTPNGSTRSGSMGATCGAWMPIRH